MRVVSWNLAWNTMKAAMHERAWRFLEQLDPDLAFVQEVQPPGWASERWTVQMQPVKRYGSAILAKRDLRLASVPGQVGGVLGRDGYLATGAVVLPDGTSLLVVSVHTPARPATQDEIDGLDPEAIRRPSVPVPWVNDVAYAICRKLVEGQRFLISGDWNVARRWDSVYGGTAGTEFFDRAERDGWEECYRVFHREEGRTWFKDGQKPYQMDHAFCDPETATPGVLTGCKIDPDPAEALRLSDHAPLILELEP